MSSNLNACVFVLDGEYEYALCPPDANGKRCRVREDEPDFSDYRVNCGHAAGSHKRVIMPSIGQAGYKPLPFPCPKHRVDVWPNAS